MSLYRELDQVKDEEQLVQFTNNLADRFGPVPETAKELVEVVRLRWAAISLGFEKLILKNGKMIGYFISDPKSHYYKSPAFSNVLSAVQKNPKSFRMKEAGEKLTLACEKVDSVKEAQRILEMLNRKDVEAPASTNS
jgi:transcription-repair coupling factor (superfamily II helicase)